MNLKQKTKQTTIGLKSICPKIKRRNDQQMFYLFMNI